MTQRAAARVPVRRGAATHLWGAPGGPGARRTGAAAGGAPGPAHPGQPRRDTRRRRRRQRRRDGHSAGSLPPRPAPAASSRPPAPSFFPGSNRHLPPAPRPRRLLSPSSPPTALPANGSARRGSIQPRLADRAGSQSRGGIHLGRQSWEVSDREAAEGHGRRETRDLHGLPKEGGHRSRRVQRTAVRPWLLGVEGGI